MSAKILLVDNDELSRFVAHELLISLGMRVQLASSGAEALNHIHKTGFDLVFMDLSMPVMDGYETTRLIRTQTEFKSLPIIALTAHTFESNSAACLQAGMNDYLAKPFALADLKKIIAKWTDRAYLA